MRLPACVRAQWMTFTRLSVILAVALIGTLIPISYLYVDRRFSEEEFDRISEGMTEGEVENVLKTPAGDYRSKWIVEAKVDRREAIGYCRRQTGLSTVDLHDRQQDDIRNWAQFGQRNSLRMITEKQWLANTWGIIVGFDHQGKVVHVRLLEMVKPNATGHFPAHVLRQFGL
jgi:hypothetical protein